eukprot:gene957-554_t
MDQSMLGLAPAIAARSPATPRLVGSTCHWRGGEEEDRVSSHSQSVISVTSIPHLQGFQRATKTPRRRRVFSSNGASSGGGLWNGNASSTGGEYVEGLLSADDDPTTTQRASAMGAGGRRASGGYANAMLPSASMHSAHTAEAWRPFGRDRGAGVRSHHHQVMGGYPQGSDFGENVDDAFRLGSRIVGMRGVEGTGLPPPSQLTREMLTGPAAMRVLMRMGSTTRPGTHAARYLSSVLRRLPELDVSSNYVGHTGFMAILGFGTSAEHSARALQRHVTGQHGRRELVRRAAAPPDAYVDSSSKQPRITLPSTKLLSLAAKTKDHNALPSRTRIGDSVIKKLETLASDHRFASQEGDGMNEMDLSEQASFNGNACRQRGRQRRAVRLKAKEGTERERRKRREKREGVPFFNAVKDVDEVKPEE